MVFLDVPGEIGSRGLRLTRSDGLQGVLEPLAGSMRPGSFYAVAGFSAPWPVFLQSLLAGSILAAAGRHVCALTNPAHLRREAPVKRTSILAGAISLAVPTICSAASYTIAGLGGAAAEAFFGRGSSVSASGQVAGVADSGFEYPAVFNGDAVNVLNFEGSATGINDVGQVVGETFFPSHLAFVYDNGTVTYLGESQGMLYGHADGINNNGDIVGNWVYSNVPNGPIIDGAFLYSGGVMHDLNSLISPSSGWVLQDAQAINSSGQITGYGMIGGQQHAFLYSAGTVADLGTLPGAISYAGHALNSSCQVVGEADFPDGSQHAFLYSNGSMHDSGPGWATGINASGEVVGNSIVNGGERPFVYIGGTKYDLNSLLTPSMASQVKIFEASAINDGGQIAGTGAFYQSSVTSAVLMTPTPEPSSLVLAALGFFGLAAWGWRRRKR
jgi:probable HAF family extracellular repeat protein